MRGKHKVGPRELYSKSEKDELLNFVYSREIKADIQKNPDKKYYTKLRELLYSIF